MGCFQCVGYVDGNGDNAFCIQGTGCDHVFQRHAVQILHGDESLSVMLADFVDCADVGMVQGRRSLSLSLKARQCLGILGHFIGEKLQRDESVQGYVLGLVNNTHASAAELLENAVMRDDLADHEETFIFGVSPACLIF